jgi:cytochrome P450
MTAVQIHHDEAIWGGDSHTFRPERFLEHPRLDKYLLHFSRGSRPCIGQNLANAEIYHILARVWRVYGSKGVSMEEDEGVLELYETQERDVKCSAHLNFPAVWKGSKGVRVRVSRR